MKKHTVIGITSCWDPLLSCLMPCRCLHEAWISQMASSTDGFEVQQHLDFRYIRHVYIMQTANLWVTAFAYGKQHISTYPYLLRAISICHYETGRNATPESLETASLRILPCVLYMNPSPLKDRLCCHSSSPQAPTSNEHWSFPTSNGSPMSACLRDRTDATSFTKQ